MATNKIFYTDSSGRDFLKRVWLISFDSLSKVNIFDMHCWPTNGSSLFLLYISFNSFFTSNIVFLHALAFSLAIDLNFLADFVLWNP